MNINKNSWHFKFNLWYKSNNMWKMPKTLCGYFWTTVMHIIMSIVVIGFLSMVCWLFGWPILTELAIFSWLTSAVPVWAVHVLGVPVGLIAWSAVVGSVVGVTIGTGNLIHNMKEKRRVKRYDEMVKRVEAGLPPEEHNVFWGFIKARKEKVCPLIDYVEGEKK